MRKILLTGLLSICLIFPSRPARADLFGGDVAVLIQILAQAIQTVTQLRYILETGADTLNLLRDINSGAKSGLELIRILNPNFNPGVFGSLKNPDEVLRALEEIYGAIPKGASQDLIKSQDQSVAEVISMNRNLYDYADSVDREKERIMFHAGVVSPQGAGKLQNQALAVLIGVTTQLLRTQSQMMKIMAQNMASNTRKEKFAAKNFQDNYQSLSTSLGQLPKDVKFPRMGGSK